MHLKPLALNRNIMNLRIKKKHLKKRIKRLIANQWEGAKAYSRPQRLRNLEHIHPYSVGAWNRYRKEKRIA